VPLAQRVEGTAVAVLRSSDQNRIAQSLVDERRVAPQVLTDSTRSPCGRLHPPSLRVSAC
jgi:hypothetical protein